MRRRDVLKLAGTSGLGMSAVAFAGCGTPDREFHIQSPVDIPEDTVTGLDTWYASICQDSGDGCGIIVRVKSGRARKIEGNPDYPLNRGKSSARAQAALQTLYNPDRIPNPMVPRRSRGSGQYRFMRWEEVLPEFQEKLGAAQESGIVMISEPVNGHMGMILERFTQSIGARWLTYEPLEQAAVRQASQQVFGTTRLPQFDIANTAYSAFHRRQLFGRRRCAGALRPSLRQFPPRSGPFSGHVCAFRYAPDDDGGQCRRMASREPRH